MLIAFYRPELEFRWVTLQGIVTVMATEVPDLLLYDRVRKRVYRLQFSETIRVPEIQKICKLAKSNMYLVYECPTTYVAKIIEKVSEARDVTRYHKELTEY
jgi:hypothetical protein